MTLRRERRRRVNLHHMLKAMPGAKKHYLAYLAELLHYLTVTPRDKYDVRRVEFMGEAYRHRTAADQFRRRHPNWICPKCPDSAGQ